MDCFTIMRYVFLKKIYCPKTDLRNCCLDKMIQVILKKFKDMDRNKFNEKIASISNKKTIPSKTGVASYKLVSINNKECCFKKLSNNVQSIEIDSLYKAYAENNSLNTTSMAEYIKSYNRSPAIAILMAAGLIDENGNKINL